MSEVQINNKVYLMGRVTTAPAFTHEVMGEGFYEILLAVKRMSEQEDIIPVTLSERTETRRRDSRRRTIQKLQQNREG